jgi:hypothetical protein
MEPARGQPAPGVYLIAAGHEDCAFFLPGAPKAVIANLGYLPGSDHRTLTQESTTLRALDQVAARLASGGRLAVVAYPGHVGGEQESAAVEAWFGSLKRDEWDVLRIEVGNCPTAPRLFVAEKRQG